MDSTGRAPLEDRGLEVALAIVDFPMLVSGFRAAIDGEPDMHVTGVVEDDADLGGQVARLDADVAIVECPSGDGNGHGFESFAALRAACPATRVVALDCRLTADRFQLAIKAGADGFLTREAHPADVVAAVRCVSRGETYVSPTIVTRMVNTYVLRNVGTSIEDPYDALTEREREVLLLAAVGHTNREIAQSLRVSEQTVHNQRANVMEKLGLHDRVDLLKFAVRRGVIDVTNP